MKFLKLKLVNMGMSGRTYNARQNEITKDYYFYLKRAIADGLIKADIYETKQQDGQSIYFLN